METIIKKKLKICDDLFYVLGALLGDGCAYKWKDDASCYVILIGDHNFTKKYAAKLSNCIGRPIKPFFITSKGIWSVNVGSTALFLLFTVVRKDLEKLSWLIGRDKVKALNFVEGFFDAEGCVKIINEKVRKTPKICPDITNTNFEYLELVKRYLKEYLDIEARYSVQEAHFRKDGSPRKKSYHLRIYKKAYVKIFLENIHTTKLKEEKVPYVEKWLNNGK